MRKLSKKSVQKMARVNRHKQMLRLRKRHHKNKLLSLNKPLKQKTLKRKDW